MGSLVLGSKSSRAWAGGAGAPPPQLRGPCRVVLILLISNQQGRKKGHRIRVAFSQELEVADAIPAPKHWQELGLPGIGEAGKYNWRWAVLSLEMRERQVWRELLTVSSRVVAVPQELVLQAGVKDSVTNIQNTEWPKSIGSFS